MSVSPSWPGGPAGHAASVPGPRRGLGALAILLACCAVAVAVALGPLSDRAAWALRPPQLDGVTRYSNVELQAIVDPARQHLWALTLVGFAALVALAGAATLVGRRALREWVDERTLERFGTWSLWCLVAGLVLGLVPYLLDVFRVSNFVLLPMSTNLLLTSLALADEVGSVILGGVALVRPAGTSVPTDSVISPAWRGKVRLGLGAAILVSLSAFALLAFVAQFTLGFYLRLVF